MAMAIPAMDYPASRLAQKQSSLHWSTSKGSSSDAVLALSKKAAASRYAATRTTSLPRLGGSPAGSGASSSAPAASAWREDNWVAQARPLPEKVVHLSSEQLQQGLAHRRGQTKHLRPLLQNHSRPRSRQQEDKLAAEAAGTESRAQLLQVPGSSSGHQRSLQKRRRSVSPRERAASPASPNPVSQAPASPLPVEAGYKKPRGDLERLADELEMPSPDFHKVEGWLRMFRKTDPESLNVVFKKHLRAPQHGLGILHKAARAGSCATVKAFLAAGGDLNLANALGWTALHYACDGGQAKLVKILLELGADVSTPTLGGTTPLHLACQSAADDCVLVILRHAPGYVMVDQEDSNRATAMKMAKTPAVRWLLDYYKEYPSIRHRDDGAWSSEVILGALDKPQRSQFGAALKSLLCVDCPGCEAAFALADVFPGMPTTLIAHTRSFLPSCPGPNACRRACSVPCLH